MKLLSRFIWLIIAILAIVFAGVALFQIKAVNEFELIKNSIKSEYDVQVDKMLQPDFYGSGFSGYMSGVVSDQSTALFLQENTPDPVTLNTIFTPTFCNTAMPMQYGLLNPTIHYSTLKQWAI